MGVNKKHLYDVDHCVAEIYDTFLATETDDIKFLQSLMHGLNSLRILEPFCGTGRFLVPLASDGHEIVGIDRTSTMLARARMKIAQLPDTVAKRILLIKADVTTADWPGGFDLVLLASNCFYELATPEEQERCVAMAATALKPGGYLYIDNDHMEGDLHDAWRKTGIQANQPLLCADGTRYEAFSETIWYDAAQRLHRSRRRIVVTMPDGKVVDQEFIIQKHPISVDEVQSWLTNHGLLLEKIYRNYQGDPYVPEDAGRAIFLARKLT